MCKRSRALKVSVELEINDGERSAGGEGLLACRVPTLGFEAVSLVEIAGAGHDSAAVRKRDVSMGCKPWSSS